MVGTLNQWRGLHKHHKPRVRKDTRRGLPRTGICLIRKPKQCERLWGQCCHFLILESMGGWRAPVRDSEVSVTHLPHCLPNVCPELRSYSARPGDHSACTWAGSPPPAEAQGLSPGTGAPPPRPAPAPPHFVIRPFAGSAGAGVRQRDGLAPLDPAGLVYYG